MYRAFKMMVNNNIRDVEIYNHNGSMWGILTKNEQWVFEFTKKGVLWYNYRFFTEIFNFFSMTAVDGKDLITKWFEETYLNINQVKQTEVRKRHLAQQVEDTIQNGVKKIRWDGELGTHLFEDVIENGVKETKFNQTEQERKYDEIFGDNTFQKWVKDTVFLTGVIN